MRSLSKHQSIWEGHGSSDALWAVVTDPRFQGGKWKPEDFFKTGQREVRAVLGHLRSKGIKPNFRGKALDFGCGVGRLTAALSAHFSSALGLDIASAMVEQARRFHAKNTKARFQVNARWDLSALASDSFDFVYASIVLQHIPSQAAEAYIREFLRVLKPGGILAFNLPFESRVPWLSLWRYKLRLRTRAKQLVQALGLARFEGFDPHPIDMYPISQGRIRAVVASAGGSMLDEVATNTTDETYYAGIQFLPQARADVAYPALMYTVRKVKL
jgi:SAM-dependent methyltransferase